MPDMATIAAQQDVLEVRRPFVIVCSVAAVVFVLVLVGWYAFLWLV